MYHSDIKIALSLELVKHATAASDPHALFTLLDSVGSARCHAVIHAWVSSFEHFQTIDDSKICSVCQWS